MPNYPNRSDLRDVPTYGDKAEITRSKQALPPGRPPTEVSYTAPGSLPDLLRPTERPNSPITTGANFGSGINALQAGIPLRSPQQSAIDEIAAISQMYPTEELTSLLDKYRKNQ
jgi:hypothetical protein